MTTGEDADLIDLLREALPIVQADAREWFEGASEASNRRRMAESADLADRIETVVTGFGSREASDV